MKNEPKIQVQEVMARDVRTIDSLASIRTAMEIMAASPNYYNKIMGMSGIIL